MTSRRSVPRPLWWRIIPPFLAALILISSWYLVEQGLHLFVHLFSAQPVAGVARRSPEYAAFLAETESIRRFGIDVLGLRPTNSYTRFIRTNSDHVAVVVSAVRPGTFDRKEWRFPIVGTVPYLGFYRERAAMREADRLQSQGWETYVRRVGAFSSLGYFPDPLYSYMADYHPERLAEMILHEMTHATIWFPDDVPLNEAIATFVGRAGALAYLESRYGPASPQLSQALRRQAERDTFVRFMRELAGRLDTLYSFGDAGVDTLLGTSAIISEEMNRFAASYDLWFADESYAGFLRRGVNNAYIDLYRTYNSDLDLVAAFHALSGSSIPEFLARAAALQSEHDPRRVLEGQES